MVVSPVVKKAEKGGKKGDRKGDGKGKGPTTPRSTPPGSPASSDSEGGGKKTNKDFQGTLMKDVPDDQKCCVYWLWVNKTTGKSMCRHAREGKPCPLPHLDKATGAVKKTRDWAKMKHLYGDPNGPPKS